MMRIPSGARIFADFSLRSAIIRVPEGIRVIRVQIAMQIDGRKLPDAN